MFKFYFQSGEFSTETTNLVKDFLIPFLGIGVPLFLYWLTNRNEKTKDDQLKLRFQEDKMRYLSHLMEGALLFSKSFHQNLCEIINELQVHPLRVAKIKWVTDENLRRIVKEVPQEDFYLAYRNKFNDNNIDLLFSSFDTIYGLKGNFEYIRNDSIAQTEFYDNILKESMGDVISLAMRIKIENEEDQKVLDGLLLIFNQCKFYDITDYMVLNDNFFEPIVNYLLDNNAWLNELKWISVRTKAMQYSNKICLEWLQSGYVIIENYKEISAALNSINLTIEASMSNFRK